MKILLYPQFDADRLQRLAAVAPDIRWSNCENRQQAALEIVDADAMIGKLDAELLCRAEKLRWIQCPTASLEHFIFPELVQHPAVLTNVRGIFGRVIATQVVGYLACFARNLHIYIRQQTRGQWSPLGGPHKQDGFLSGPCDVSDIDRQHQDLSSCTLGIIGLGGIGVAIAQAVVPLGMRILGMDPVTSPRPEIEHCFQPNQLHELLPECDYVVIAAPHTPQTVGMFDERQFRQMRSNAVLINVGRGALVRLPALVAALQAEEIRGAALDVFEVEPLPPRHPLWQLPNVIITPHIAGYAPTIAQRHFQILAENTRRFANNQPLINVVDKRLWY